MALQDTPTARLHERQHLIFGVITARGGAGIWRMARHIRGVF
jgi:hypothetical protein